MLIHLAFKPGVVLVAGNRYSTRPAYDRRTHLGLVYESAPNGDYHFFRDDGLRIRIPKSSIAWALENAEPAPPMSVPTTKTWALHSVHFSVAVAVGGRWASLESWDADRHQDIRCIERGGGVVLVPPDGNVRTVPAHSINWFTDRPVAEVVTPPVEEATAEHVPVRPPIRSPKERR